LDIYYEVKQEVKKMKAKIGQIEFELETKQDVEILLNAVEKKKDLAMVLKQKIEEVSERKPSELFTKKKRKYSKSRKFKSWTESEDEIVKNNTPKRASKLLHGRTLPAVYNRKMRLTRFSSGLSSDLVIVQSKKKRVSSKHIPWSNSEDEIVKKYSPEDAAKYLPNRTKLAVYGRRIKLGISGRKVPKKHSRFEQWEIDIIKNNSPQEAMRLLPNRLKGTIYDKRYALGLGKEQKPKPKPVAEEIKFDILNKEQSDVMLGVIEHSVRKKKPLSLAEVTKTFHLSVSEARALLFDAFQQAGKIMKYIKQDKKVRIVNPNGDPSLEFY